MDGHLGKEWYQRERSSWQGQAGEHESPDDDIFYQLHFTHPFRVGPREEPGAKYLMFTEHSFYTMHITYIISFNPYNFPVRLGAIVIKPILRMREPRHREGK